MPTRTAIILLLCGGCVLGSSADAQVPLPEMRDIQDGVTLVLSHDVSVVVDAINAVSVSAGATTLTINGVVAGSPPTPVTDTGTTYNITTNGLAKKITGALNASYASGLSLAVQLAAPTGAATTQQTLSTTPKDLVTAITQLAETNLTITYTASASAAAAPNQGSGGETQTVLITLTDS